MLIEAIAISFIYGFILFEWIGLVAGGLIAPAYMALFFDRPAILALCIGIALLTLFLVRLLSFISILYGRRRFIVSILVAFALQWTIGSFIMGSEFSQGNVEVVGYIIPGLLAHEMERQGIGQTLLALLFLSALVWLTMKLLGMLPL